MPPRYDALLVVSFGGPEGQGDVMPFLENVVRGRDVPPERLRAVAAQYEIFGGRSPINDQCRALVSALESELERHGPRLKVYWGNRNWHPFLPDTLQRMACDGVERALAFVTSAFGSYSGCRQYLEDIERARRQVGEAAPTVDKLRGYHNHPGFVEPFVDSVEAAFDALGPAARAGARLLFTAHSLPRSMAAVAPYEAQLRETAALVASKLGARRARSAGRGGDSSGEWNGEWSLAYQSRSGPPSQPWLEPDLGDELRRLAAVGAKAVVLAPIGFVSDHTEVLYDLDVLAARQAAELGLTAARARTVGTHPRFVQMIRELVLERLTDSPQRLALGTSGPPPDVCAPDCCRAPAEARPRAGSRDE